MALQCRARAHFSRRSTGLLVADHSLVGDLGLQRECAFGVADCAVSRPDPGAGFGADIRLTKNLKLVTGVAISQNSLSFSTNGPLPSFSTFTTALPLNFATSTSAAGSYAIVVMPGTMKSANYQLVCVNGTLIASQSSATLHRALPR